MSEKPTLFQFAAVWHPSEDQIKEGKKSKVIVEPKTIIAKDQNQAYTVAARDIPEEYVDQLDQIAIALRPF